MAIPYQTEHHVRYDGFNPCHNASYYGAGSRLLSMYNARMVALLVPTKKEQFFIPTIALRPIAGSLDKLRTITELEKTYIVPLVIGHIETKKTSTAILKSMFRYSIYPQLRKVNATLTSYIGGTGLIMQDDFTPLMMWGYTGKVIPELGRLELGNPTVYVNPCIYTNTDVLSKYLVTKIVPFLVNTKTVTFHLRDCGTRFIYNPQVQTVRVIIEDFSHMFYKTPAPTNINYSEQINLRLAREYSGILQGLDEGN